MSEFHGDTETTTPTQQVEAGETVETTESQTDSAPAIQVGAYTGQVKAFNPKKGYGFIAVHGREGLDVFVHQTNIHPLRSTYRTLIRGEYVSFDISDDEKNQALNVRGVGGGTLRCDALSQRRSDTRTNSNTGDENGDENGEADFQQVKERRRGRGRGRGRGNHRGENTRRSPRVQNGNGESNSKRPTLADYLPTDVEA